MDLIRNLVDTMTRLNSHRSLGKQMVRDILNYFILFYFSFSFLFEETSSANKRKKDVSI